MKKLLAILLLTFLLSPTAFAKSTKNLDDIASFLGIDKTTLVSELKSGKTLQDIAISLGVDKQALRDYVNKGPNSVFSILIQQDEFAQGLADLLGLGLEELRDRLEAGETPAILAKDQGVEMVIIKGYLKTKMDEYRAAHPTPTMQTSKS